MINQMEATYELICDECRAVMGEMDERRWFVGDRAALVEKRYGGRTLDDFARDINANKSTIHGWRRVANFYPKSIREKLLDEFSNLSYSHFKDALRCGSVDEAISWLETCSLEGWSPDKAAHELTIKLGRDTDPNSSIPGTITAVFKRDGQCIVEITVGLDDMDAFKSGVSVNLKVKDI